MVYRATRSTSAMLLAILALNGCVGANWQPITVSQPRLLNESTVLEFHFKKDSIVHLHGVKFEHDSLSGIYWLDHLTCDTCRVHYAFADVSQAQTGNPGNTAWDIVLPIVGIAVIGAIYIIHLCGGVRCGD